MSDPVLPVDPQALTLPFATAREVGTRYAQSYQSAAPYPHICIDNFLPPDILDRVIADLEDLPEAQDSFDAPQERLKTSYIPERLPLYTRTLFHFLNSRAVLSFFEEMTGIRGLIPDPYFMGAGIHRVANGGHLDIHADFNLHEVCKVERRLNMLIYLNKDWKEEYGGSFEIWDKQMTGKAASFVPVFNRMVCFSTGSDTFHGNPETVNHPEGAARRSIALYYYTATWDDSRKAHSTLFKPRPGTVDEADRSANRHRVIADLLPPIVYRKVARPLRKLGI